MKTAQKGFTLAELLIALALLGVIAAFTIPKVLEATGTQEVTAKVRETVATLEQAFYNLRTKNEIITGQTLYQNIIPLLNTVAQGSGNADAAGGPYTSMTADHPCAPAVGNETSNGWVQFPNGVVVSGLTGAALTVPPAQWGQAAAANSNYQICIDYNGANNPNTKGVDIFGGNFQQFGDFDVATGAVFATSPGKSFLWTSGLATLYKADGDVSADFDAATEQAGSMLVK